MTEPMQFVPRHGVMPAVQPGQVWAPREDWSPRRLRITKVDRALVWTDGGRQTVFSLLRHYRLVQDTDRQVAA